MKPPKKDPNAAALGRKGGFARARSLSKSKRSEIAKKAAQARWKANGKKTHQPDHDGFGQVARSNVEGTPTASGRTAVLGRTRAPTSTAVSTVEKLQPTTWQSKPKRPRPKKAAGPESGDLFD
jgi:hypothetical protein